MAPGTDPAATGKEDPLSVYETRKANSSKSLAVRPHIAGGTPRMDRTQQSSHSSQSSEGISMTRTSHVSPVDTQRRSCTRPAFSGAPRPTRCAGTESTDVSPARRVMSPSEGKDTHRQALPAGAAGREEQRSTLSGTSLALKGKEQVQSMAQCNRQAPAASEVAHGHTLDTSRSTLPVTPRLEALSLSPDWWGAVLTAAARPSTDVSGSKQPMIKIGIETEFYLATMRPGLEDFEENLSKFVENLAISHNAEVAQQHPRMLPTLRPYDHDRKYEKWCLDCDGTISVTSAEPWGLELVSPILTAFPGSRWRKDVEATWGFLQRRYDISGSDLCGTHIHVSLDRSYNLRDIKRIAQAVIHFEPAFEALMPPIRRENVFAKSNWFDGPGLGKRGKSRADSLFAIEYTSNIGQIMKLMQAVNVATNTIDQRYAWNFSNIFTEKGTVEFRKSPFSLTPNEALGWAELAMSFVQAAIECDLGALQKFPANIRGLCCFVEQSARPGMNERGRMKRLWTAKHIKNPGEALEPKPQS